MKWFLVYQLHIIFRFARPMKYCHLRNCLLPLLFLCVVLPISGCGADVTWQWNRAETGLPRQVVTLAVASDPTDATHLWAGYYDRGGLATSFDGGQTWQRGADGLGDIPIFDLLAQPGDLLWAATRDGLLYSTNGGASWQPTTADLLGVTAFALAANRAGQVYVGLDNAGLYLKKQAEDDWLSLNNDPVLASAAVLSVAASPDGAQLYAGTSGRGVFASRDAGQTWVEAFPGAYVPNLALDPGRPAIAIASLRNKLVRTQDGGQSWRELPVDWAVEEIVSLLWATEGTLLAGSGQGQIYRSTDRGDTWAKVGSIPIDGGVLDLALADNRLLAATWTGVYASSNGGQDWIHLSPSLGLPNANTLLTVKTGLLLGTRAGLFRWQPEERAWQTISESFPVEEVTALAAAPGGQILYAGAESSLYRSDDGGVNWTPVPSTLDTGIQTLALDPTRPTRLYKLAFWERVYASEDGGQTWQAQWNGLGVIVEGTSLALDPLDPSTLYMGSETGLYRSRLGGDNWQPVAPALADQSILAIVARPALEAKQTASTLYLGTTRGLYRSLDGGNTVERWGQGLEHLSVTALLFNPDNPQHIYAGTAFAGIHQSTDGGQQWRPIGPAGMSTEIIRSMAWGPSGELFVASLGGVWVGEGEQNEPQPRHPR